MNTQNQTFTSVQQASPGSEAPTYAEVIPQVGGSLIVVLGIFIVLAWLVKKLRNNTGIVQNEKLLTIKHNQTLGNQGRLIIVEFDNKLLLLGVSNSAVNCIATMEKPKSESIEQHEQILQPFQQLLTRTLNRKRTEAQKSES